MVFNQGSYNCTSIHRADSAATCCSTRRRNTLASCPSGEQETWYSPIRRPSFNPFFLLRKILNSCPGYQPRTSGGVPSKGYACYLVAR